MLPPICVPAGVTQGCGMAGTAGGRPAQVRREEDGDAHK